MQLDRMQREVELVLALHAPHLGNNTNSRLESSWGKLKDLTNKYAEFDECIIAILVWQRTKERAWTRQTKSTGHAHVVDADAEITRFARVASRSAVDLVRSQYDFALLPSTVYHHYRVSEAITLISYVPPTTDNSDKDDNDDDHARMPADMRTKYHVNTRGWICSSPFMMTRLLPCRHVLCLRGIKNPRAVIPVESTHKRLLLQQADDSNGDLEITDVTPSSEEVVAALTRDLTAGERYNKLHVAAMQNAECGARVAPSASL